MNPGKLIQEMMIALAMTSDLKNLFHHIIILDIILASYKFFPQIRDDHGGNVFTISLNYFHTDLYFLSYYQTLSLAISLHPFPEHGHMVSFALPELHNSFLIIHFILSHITITTLP